MRAKPPLRMRNLNKQEQAAIEAVGKRFSTTWEKGDDSADAYLIPAGKRVAVDVATLKRHGAHKAHAAKPRLRFDKVVIRLMERLEDSLGKTVPDGTTVLLTVIAPIRLPAKTAEALGGNIQTLLERGSTRRDKKDTIHGNRVQIRIVRNEFMRAPKLIGFVHNSDSDPLLLLNLTSEVLDLVSEAATRTTRTAGDRWLVMISDRGTSWLEAYRYIGSHLRTATGFEKIIMVFGDGRVETLTE